jgi:MFS family permease
MVGTVTGATLSGRMMASVRHYKRVPVAGLALAIGATSILVARPSGLPLVLIEVILAATSIGLGTLLPVATVSIQNAVEPQELGTATATANFFRALGGALIVAVFGAILVGSGGSGLGHESSRLSHDPALASAFAWIFGAAIAGFALALAFLLAMQERPLRGRSSPGTDVRRPGEPR